MGKDRKDMFNLRQAMIEQIQNDIAKEPKLSKNFKEKNIMATKKSFKYDVSFLFGEEENSKFVRDIYDSLTGNKQFNCLPPTSCLNFQELDNANYALVFFSKQTVQCNTDVSFKSFQFPLYCLVSNKLQKTGVNIIPVLIDVDISEIPSYLQWLTYVDCRKDEKNYMDRIEEILTGPDKEIHSSLPVGDVYNGLALGYFHNYLSFMLQASGFAPEDFSSNDSNISPVKAITLAKKNEAAAHGRGYKVEIYKVNDGNQEFAFLGHYATPVLTLSEMVKDQIAGLSRQEMESQAKKFNKFLVKNLESESKLRNKYCVIYYDDTKTRLSEELIKHLREEFRQDF